MVSSHLLNLIIHISAGVMAIPIGLWLLAMPKGTALHRQRGRIFAWITLVVCATAVIGNAIFRFMPLFAVLTVLVLYQLLSGWHVVYTKAAGPNRIDALLCTVAALAGACLVPIIFANTADGKTLVVVYATLGALFALLAYDALRWWFPRHWHAFLWRYEHIYKLIASLTSMTSAAAGNLFPQGQPWSQLLPSALGIVAIGWCFVREAGIQKARRKMLRQPVPSA